MNILRQTFFGLSLFLLTACDPGSANLLEGQELNQMIRLEDGIYMVSAPDSRLEWKAFENGQDLMGGVSLRDNAKLQIKDGMLQSGKLLIDLNSIKSNEPARLTDESEELLDMENYPYAFFEILETKPYEGEEDYQWEIKGDLTFKEAMIPLIILAKPKPAGSDFIIQGHSQMNLSLLGLGKNDQLDLTIELLIKG